MLENLCTLLEKLRNDKKKERKCTKCEDKVCY